MLTPRSDDPNREAELKRKQEDPGSFGATLKEEGFDRGSPTQKQAENQTGKGSK